MGGRVKLTVGSLFSGIGGFDLGFERAGWAVKWQVENDPFCNAVLEARWPGTRRYGDITGLDPSELEQVDLICGGFPCQDISAAGHRKGIDDGERSGLWREMLRIIHGLRPRYALVENPAAILGRGLGRVLGDLSESGYDAEWDCLPAASFGAPHIRDRTFIFAYSRREPGDRARHAHNGLGYLGLQRNNGHQAERGESRELIALAPGIHARTSTDWWMAQSRVDRTTDGVPEGLDGYRNRYRALGNAVVPQVAEWLGRRIAVLTKEREMS